MELFAQPMKLTENLTHLSYAFVSLRDLGVGLCGQSNHTEKCCFYSLSAAEDYEASGYSLCSVLPLKAMGPYIAAGASLAIVVMIIWFVGKRCSRRRTLHRRYFGSHTWSRRKVFWRQKNLSRAAYVALALRCSAKTRSGCNEEPRQTQSRMTVKIDAAFETGVKVGNLRQGRDLFTQYTKKRRSTSKKASIPRTSCPVLLWICLNLLFVGNL